MSTAIIPPTPNSGGSNLAVSAHEFEALMVKATASSTYSADQVETLRWWYFTAKQHSWNLARLAKNTGLSTTTLYRLFRVDYSADPAPSITKLVKARENFSESADNPEFIETSLSARLFAIFDKTRALKNVSILWGQMGIGKTECIGEYVRQNNHGRTICVRFPAGSSFAFFVSHLARHLGVAKTQSAYQQRDRIIQVLSAGQRLLIIDELHQAFLTTRTDTAVKCCEFLREIADCAACGLVLVGTELMAEAIFRGPHKDALRQLVDRGTVQVALPAKATKKDYQKFLRSYGLDFPDPTTQPEATEILADIIKSSGLRKLTLHLRDGAAYANKLDQAYDWKHFVAAFEAILSLGK